MSKKGISACAIMLMVLAVPAVASTPSGNPFNEIWEAIGGLDEKVDYANMQLDAILNVTKGLDDSVVNQLSGMWIAINWMDNRIEVLEDNMSVVQSKGKDDEVDYQLNRMKDAIRDTGIKANDAIRKSDKALNAVNELSDKVDNIVVTNQSIINNKYKDAIRSYKDGARDPPGDLLIKESIYETAGNYSECINSIIRGGGAFCVYGKPTWNHIEGNGWHSECLNIDGVPENPITTYAICLQNNITYYTIRTSIYDQHYVISGVVNVRAFINNKDYWRVRGYKTIITTNSSLFDEVRDIHYSEFESNVRFLLNEETNEISWIIE